MQPVGNNTFPVIGKGVCQVEGIRGIAVKGCVTTHRLRGTLVPLLYEHEHSDSFTVLRIGHRDPRYLNSYKHLRGYLGLQQQHLLLEDDDRTERSGKVPFH